MRYRLALLIPLLGLAMILATGVTYASVSQAAAAAIPQCPHADTKWHGLVERNANGSIACTYGHEHGDNPHTLDQLLGTLRNGEISYPWQTVNASTGAMENHTKHQVYKWNVIRNAQCIPSNSTYSFSNIRLQVHADGNMGATTRFHSYYVQAVACDPRSPAWRGTISIGGWLDYGHLQAPDGHHVRLPGDPQVIDFGGPRRLHGSPTKYRGDFTWYGDNRFIASNGRSRVAVSLGIRKEDWGPVNPNNPTGPVLFYGGGNNGSYMEPVHLLTLTVPSELADRRTGLVNYRGFVNRWGNVVATCSPVGVDCIPLDLVNMKAGYYQFRADAHGITTREYDVIVNGRSLIRFPN